MSVVFTSPIRPRSTLVRRPICSPRTSIWTIVASFRIELLIREVGAQHQQTSQSIMA